MSVFWRCRDDDCGALCESEAGAGPCPRCFATDVARTFDGGGR